MNKMETKNEYSEYFLCDDDEVIKNPCSQFGHIILASLFSVIVLKALQQWGLWIEKK